MEWFRNLESRERLYVLIGTFAVIATLYFLLVFEPLVNGKKQALTQYASALNLYQFMQETSSEVTDLRQQLSSQGPKVTADKLLGLIDQGLRKTGIAKDLKSINPEPDGGVRLRFDNVSFDKLIRWLTESHNQLGVNIALFTVTETRQSGRVKASLLLN